MGEKDFRVRKGLIVDGTGTSSIAGSLGIGTTAPDTIFHISSATHPSIRITGTDNAGADPAIEMLGQGNSFGEGMQMWYDNGSGIAHIASLYNNANADIQFHTRVAADRSTSNVRMVIEGDGNVGIGTTTPDQKLHVEGSILADAYNFATTTLASDYTDGETSLVLTDASQFPTAGSGTINGVAFTWTNKSSNTLTVPDLDASYTASVTVVADTGLFFRDGFENVAQPSVTIYDKDNSGATRDDLSINANAGIRFRLGNESQMQLTADQLSLTTGNQGANAIFGFRDRTDMGLKSNNSYSVGVLAPDNVFIQTDSNNNGSSNYIDFGHGSNSVGSAESMMRIVMDGTTGPGKVGIGTTSPDSQLDISSASTATLRLSNSDTGLTEDQITGEIIFYQDDDSGSADGITGRIGMRSAKRLDGTNYYGDVGDMGFFVAGSGNFTANTNAALEAMTIRAGGNVGIGTTTPAEKLHVAGDIRVNDNASIQANGSGYLQLGNTSGGDIRVFGDGSSSRIQAHGNHLYLQTNRDADDIIFATNAGGTDSDSTVVEAMRIHGPDGYVGIGTTTPAVELDVNGMLNITQRLSMTNSGGFSRIEMQGSSGAYIDMKNDTTDDYDVRFLTDGSGLDIYTNAAIRMKVEDDKIQLQEDLHFATGAAPTIHGGSQNPLTIYGNSDGTATSTTNNVVTRSTSAAIDFDVNTSQQLAMRVKDNKDVDVYGVLSGPGIVEGGYGANSFHFGDTGGTEDDDWYEVFRWTPNATMSATTSNQYRNFAARFQVIGRGIQRINFDMYVRGEYGVQDSNGWWTKEFIIDGLDQSTDADGNASPDGDSIFKMVYNSGTSLSMPFASLYMRRDEDWELRTCNLISMFTNCVFEFKDTNVGETTPTNDGETGSADLSPTIRRKLRVDANNQVINGVGGTGIYFDDTNDRLGIGEATPGSLLEIRGATTIGTTTGHIMLTGDSATNGQGPQIVFSESGSGSSFAGAYIGHARTGSNSMGDLIFGTRATSGDASTVPTERMRILANGNVGIGTTSPDAVLNVISGTNDEEVLKIGNTAGNSGSTAGITHLGISHWDSGTHSSTRITATEDAAGSYLGSLSFGTRGAASDSAPTERMRITSAGNVGIGTTSPSVPLEVNGEIKGSKINLTAGTDAFTIQSSNPAREKKIYATTSGDGSPFDEMVFHSEGSTGGWSGQHTFTVSKSEDDGGVGNSPYTAFRVRDSGNGTSSEVLVSHKLGVGILDPIPMFHIYGDNTTTNQTTSGAASITIENDGTGDVAVNYLLTGIRRWITGIDNSDADKFKISTGGTDIGTGAKLAIDTSGNAVIAGDVQAATASITGLMTSGTALINSSHSFSNTPAITTNGVAINGTNTTKVRAESSTYSFSQSYTLAGNLNSGAELELFRFNVTNASYRKFQAGRMFIRVQVTNPQSGGSGFFQQTVTFGDDASGGAAQSTTDRIDSSMTGGNAAYDHEKATIVVSRVSDYICVKFKNDTGVAILTGSGFQAQLSCELFELDAMPS
jgi:hypothetical protein